MPVPGGLIANSTALPTLSTKPTRRSPLLQPTPRKTPYIPPAFSALPLLLSVSPYSRLPCDQAAARLAPSAFEQAGVGREGWGEYLRRSLAMGFVRRWSERGVDYIGLVGGMDDGEGEEVEGRTGTEEGEEEGTRKRVSSTPPRNPRLVKRTSESPVMRVVPWVGEGTPPLSEGYIRIAPITTSTSVTPPPPSPVPETTFWTTLSPVSSTPLMPGRSPVAFSLPHSIVPSTTLPALPLPTSPLFTHSPRLEPVPCTSAASTLDLTDPLPAIISSRLYSLFLNPLPFSTTPASLLVHFPPALVFDTMVVWDDIPSNSVRKVTVVLGWFSPSQSQVSEINAFMKRSILPWAAVNVRELFEGGGIVWEWGDVWREETREGWSGGHARSLTPALVEDLEVGRHHGVYDGEDDGSVISCDPEPSKSTLEYSPPQLALVPLCYLPSLPKRPRSISPSMAIADGPARMRNPDIRTSSQRDVAESIGDAIEPSSVPSSRTTSQEQHSHPFAPLTQYLAERPYQKATSNTTRQALRTRYGSAFLGSWSWEEYVDEARKAGWVRVHADQVFLGRGSATWNERRWRGQCKARAAAVRSSEIDEENARASGSGGKLRTSMDQDVPFHNRTAEDDSSKTSPATSTQPLLASTPPLLPLTLPASPPSSTLLPEAFTSGFYRITLSNLPYSTTSASLRALFPDCRLDAISISSPLRPRGPVSATVGMYRPSKGQGRQARRRMEAELVKVNAAGGPEREEGEEEEEGFDSVTVEMTERASLPWTWGDVTEGVREMWDRRRDSQ